MREEGEGRSSGAIEFSMIFDRVFVKWNFLKCKMFSSVLVVALCSRVVVLYNDAKIVPGEVLLMEFR